MNKNTRTLYCKKYDHLRSGNRKLRKITREEQENNKCYISGKEIGNPSYFTNRKCMNLRDLKSLLLDTSQHAYVMHTNPSKWCHIFVCPPNRLGPITNNTPIFLVDNSSELITFYRKADAITTLKLFLGVENKRIHRSGSMSICCKERSDPKYLRGSVLEYLDSIID